MSAQMQEQVRARSFRFGPRETSGIFLGLGMGSLLAVFGAVFVLTRLLAHGGLGIAFGLALVAGTVAAVWVPVADRPIAAWLPIAAVHVTRRALGWTRYRGGPAACTDGQGGGEGLHLPGELAELVIVSVDTAAGPVGVIKDRRRGLFTVVLRVEGAAFQLLTPDEQDARLASWGETLAGLANSTAGIVRVHLTDTTVPDCGDALARRWSCDGGQGTEGTAASYGELLDLARPVTQKHEAHVALTLDPRKVRRQIRTLGHGRDAGAGACLLQRAVAFADELSQAGVAVAGALPPRGLAKLLRTSYEPGARWALEARGPENEGGGAAPDEAGPAAADSSAWSYYRTDDTFHVTYWIAEWPRHDVPGVFLQDLILRTTCERTLSVCLEPRDPRRAADEVARRQTAKGADENLRSRLGFNSTAHNRRESAELTAQDEELASGEALYRFIGLIRISAPDLETLDQACGDVEIAAKNLKLRRLYGEQDAAFNASLPLGRGLRWGWLR
jgi:hypothetical protein